MRSAEGPNLRLTIVISIIAIDSCPQRKHETTAFRSIIITRPRPIQELLVAACEIMGREREVLFPQCLERPELRRPKSLAERWDSELTAEILTLSRRSRSPSAISCKRTESKPVAKLTCESTIGSITQTRGSVREIRRTQGNLGPFRVAGK